ncbi:hypothetical protein [Alicyclobacillus acidoterrestris]|uniref:Uncharacterized protein n=1 Tax=Alicyclobacillus acidoterrestris (strain ATCC 49025 / DSM 3922 / CIP 106132 / NCIMB 13137 / GD3B) TaxID=1356854 RepID=T0BJ92_ALIAG|nr:hypothetical protein [Alicyclobacillus acidoterrestris]EPZ40660.1 hypothetical protein N007_17880 [Alicyclobacillus acidoterrestris ATCC 49025]UNO49050.1 hypothetical protein K1I37_00295 [Alicyclobacillus acidoterrestris]
MHVIAKITDINPVHGVLAEATVTIDSLLKIKSVRLERSPSLGVYRIQMPVAKSTDKPEIELLDKELKIKILEAVKAQYEKRALYPKYQYDNVDSYRTDRIQENRSRSFKQDLKRTKNMRSV